MLNRLRFAFSYAFRNMRRDRQRTLFALFSIAVGVATVVALRMLGVMLTDAFTSNVQALTRGDIVITGNNSGPRISVLGGTSTPPFSEPTLNNIRRWAESNNAQVTSILAGELTQAALISDGKAGRPAFTNQYFIDPAVYPFYDTIRPTAPAGSTLPDLLREPGSVVLAERMAQALGAQIGDTIRVGTAERTLIVTGLVSDTSEGLNSPFSLIFGFMYANLTDAALFDLNPNVADRVYIRLTPGTNVTEAVESIIQRSPGLRYGARFDTAESQLARNTVIADLSSRFVLLLSLVALVIGSTGIVNTMIVAVNRRANEIAVMKTLGLKGRSVRNIFLAEAILLGIFGSLLGCILGVGLGALARTFGEQAFSVPLPFRITLDPFVLGVVLGVLFTVVFSLLPIFMAVNVRPAEVLRQNSALVGRAGCFPTLISLGVLIITLGLIVQWIIGDPLAELINVIPQRATTARANTVALQQGLNAIPSGIIVVLIAFAVIGLFLMFMQLIVWLLGKLPSFRNANLRLAFRGLTLYRGRTALSMLALVIGMSALSGTLILSRSVNQLLYTTLSGPIGGNVITLPLLPLTSSFVRGALDSAPGVRGYRDVRITSAVLQVVNGDRTLINEMRNQDADDGQVNPYFNFFVRQALVVGTRVYKTPNRNELVAGRYLNEDDNGKYVAVISDDPALQVLGITIGSKLGYSINGSRPVTYEVVGITRPGAQEGFIPFSLGDSAVQVPIDTINGSIPFDVIIADVAEGNLNDAMAAVGAVPGVFVFDVGVFDSIINSFLSRAAALPLLVALLSLFAATVLIATTVSLATLERRRQIGVLKALGVKRRDVLTQLLIENGIVGLVGGLLALLPTAAILVLVPVVSQNLITLPTPYDLIALMLVLSVVITIGATLLTAWGASQEKPLQVLRYE